VQIKWIKAIAIAGHGSGEVREFSRKRRL